MRHFTCVAGISNSRTSTSRSLPVQQKSYRRCLRNSQRTNLQLCRVSQDVRNRSFDSVKKRQAKSYACPAQADRFSSLERRILIVCYLFDYLVNVGRMKRGARGSWKYWKCECAFAPSFCASDFRSSFSICSEISTSGNLCKWQISAFVKLRDRRLNLRKHNESFPRVRLSSCW